MTSIRPSRPLYGTTGRCSCGWEFKTNQSPTAGGSKLCRDAHARHVAEVVGTVERRQVTWVRWDPKRLREVASHPWQWVWTDPEGVERCYGTKRDALTAQEEWGS
jgi:hypothetical protein